MFERYTEPARRVIFFARYEASQCAAPAIEPEHVLMGLLRENKDLLVKLTSLPDPAGALRKSVEHLVLSAQATSVCRKCKLEATACRKSGESLEFSR